MSVFGEMLDAGVQMYNIKHNDELTQQTWARDDNAIQRRVADLKAAGLSPTLAAGSAAATSAPIKASASTNFGGQSVAQDIADYQAIKNRKLSNEALQISNEQAQQELDTYKKFGPWANSMSSIAPIAIVAGLLTGKPINEVLSGLSDSFSSFFGGAKNSFGGATGDSSSDTYLSSQEASTSPGQFALTRVKRQMSTGNDSSHANSTLQWMWDNYYLNFRYESSLNKYVVSLSSEKAVRYYQDLAKLYGVSTRELSSKLESYYNGKVGQKVVSEPTSTSSSPTSLGGGRAW